MLKLARHDFEIDKRPFILARAASVAVVVTAYKTIRHTFPLPSPVYRLPFHKVLISSPVFRLTFTLFIGA